MDTADLQLAAAAAAAVQTRARECVTRLQSGDEVILAAWRRICEASRREFQALYKRLDVTLQVRCAGGQGQAGSHAVCAQHLLLLLPSHMQTCAAHVR